MNKPIYLGQAILDLSKIIMYEFHYDYMLPKYVENLRLGYMDSDSFVYDIMTDNFYKNIANRSKQEGYWPYEGRTGWKDHDQVRDTHQSCTPLRRSVRVGTWSASRSARESRSVL